MSVDVTGTQSETLAPDDPRHGTYNGYQNLGCRCQPCREANTVYMREARRKRSEVSICPNCSGPGGLYADSICKACYEYKRRTGRIRPVRDGLPECFVDLCKETPNGHGLCGLHYMRWYRGKPLRTSHEQAIYEEVERLRELLYGLNDSGVA